MTLLYRCRHKLWHRQKVKELLGNNLNTDIHIYYISLTYDWYSQVKIRAWSFSQSSPYVTSFFAVDKKVLKEIRFQVTIGVTTMKANTPIVFNPKRLLGLLLFIA